MLGELAVEPSSDALWPIMPILADASRFGDVFICIHSASYCKYIQLKRYFSTCHIYYCWS